MCELASTSHRCASSEEYSGTLITCGTVTETQARSWIFPPRFVINVPNGRSLLAICILATAHLTLPLNLMIIPHRVEHHGD